MLFLVWSIAYFRSLFPFLPDSRTKETAFIVAGSYARYASRHRPHCFIYYVAEPYFVRLTQRIVADSLAKTAVHSQIDSRHFATGQINILTDKIRLSPLFPVKDSLCRQKIPSASARRIADNYSFAEGCLCRRLFSMIGFERRFCHQVAQTWRRKELRIVVAFDVYRLEKVAESVIPGILLQLALHHLKVRTHHSEEPLIIGLLILLDPSLYRCLLRIEETNDVVEEVNKHIRHVSALIPCKVVH